MVKQRGIGTSHAKIILMGDHSVVYGQPAIALPLPSVKLTVTLTRQADQQQFVASRYFNGKRQELPAKMKGIAKLLDYLVKQFNGQEDGWTLQIDSQLPAERGMGSSAATAVAIVRAFFDFYGQKLDRPTLLQLADIEEEITHRSPSGLDAATVSSSQPLYYIKGRAGVPTPLNLSATMVIADTGIKGATREAIMAVQQLLRDQPAVANKHIEHLGQLVVHAREYLKQNEAAKLGAALTAAHTDLQALQVSDDHLDHLVQTALANGALGAKLTGGGRGGCMFALVKTPAAAKELAQTLEENGAKRTWLQSLDLRGGK